LGFAEAVALAALAVSLPAIVISMSGESGRPLPADFGGEPQAPASATEAAAVLTATAAGARSALPPVGPGEYMLTRTLKTIRGEGAAEVEARSWTASDGSALVIERGRYLRECPSFSQSPPGCTPGWVSETTTTRFRAGGDPGEVTLNGAERRFPPQLTPNWRYVVPGDEVARLPAGSAELLASLRAGADRAVRLYERPRPEGYHPRVDRRYDLLGHDLLVVETATDLLFEAPLGPHQRAALLSLLADAPNWYRPGTGAEPLQVRNLGATTDALGRAGTAVRFGGFDLVLDPEAGRLLELRAYEHGMDAEPIRLTLESQRVVDSAGGERDAPA